MLVVAKRSEPLVPSLRAHLFKMICESGGVFGRLAPQTLDECAPNFFLTAFLFAQFVCLLSEPVFEFRPKTTLAGFGALRRQTAQSPPTVFQGGQRVPRGSNGWFRLHGRIIQQANPVPQP